MLAELLQSWTGRLVASALALLVVAVALGVVLLWPAGASQVNVPAGISEERAEVVGVSRARCPQMPRQPCQRVSARLVSGADTGMITKLTLPGTNIIAAVTPGDAIRLYPNDVQADAGAPEAVPAIERYSFSDFERRSPLYLLAALFGGLVILLARWKGVRSLLGLGLSLVVVSQFMVPAILAGSAPLAVALIGALAVMLLTIVLAHGTGVTSIAAILGSTASLLGTAILALLFVEMAKLSGFASEEATLLQGSADGRLSMQGLLLAGMVVGALGVLDDVTVSQASTVLALKRAAPTEPMRRLFREALAVGRDHLSATVNTLVLAYVGAALPVLLIFENQGMAFGDALNREAVAGPVVAMLVGSIGLIAAVPLTTALAAGLAQRLPRAVVTRGGGHAHVH